MIVGPRGGGAGCGGGVALEVDAADTGGLDTNGGGAEGDVLGTGSGFGGAMNQSGSCPVNRTTKNATTMPQIRTPHARQLARYLSSKSAHVFPPASLPLLSPILSPPIRNRWRSYRTGNAEEPVARVELSQGTNCFFLLPTSVHRVRRVAPRIIPERTPKSTSLRSGQRVLRLSSVSDALIGL